MVDLCDDCVTDLCDDCVIDLCDDCVIVSQPPPLTCDDCAVVSRVRQDPEESTWLPRDCHVVAT